MKLFRQKLFDGACSLVVACLSVACMSQQSSPLAIEPTRSFAPVPPIGVHPRVLLSPQEMPDLKDRLLHTANGQNMMRLAEQQVEHRRQLFTMLGAFQPKTITKATLDEYFKPDESRNPVFLMAALLGIVHDRPEMKHLAIGAIVGYSNLILKSRELDEDDAEPKNALTTSTSSNTSLWHSHHWDVSTGWLFGGPGLALTYDLLYNDMTPAQRDTVRSGISAATSHRRSWGLGEEDTRAVSNWTLYHGHLMVMALAIEGEPGYDAALYPLWTKLSRAYLHHAFTAAGANAEDSYPLGTSFRDSASMFVAMARRGDNLFLDPRYQGYMRYVLQSLEPWQTGGFIGHAAGGNLGYPSFWVTNRYVFPTSPIANYEWHFYAGDNYQNHVTQQSFVELLLFSGDWTKDLPGWNDRAALRQPTSVFYPGRGLEIVRSDWTLQQLLVQIDARPDAFLIGHDNADRGTFTVTALGKTWVPDLDWMGFQYADEHSLVQIDGKSEPYKAPSVNFLGFQDRGSTVISSADLSYAYDWQWPEPWPAMDRKFAAPWTIEPNDPRMLGLPDTEEWAWIPKRLHDEPSIGFAGLNFWRKQYNPVQYVYRSLALVRSQHPWLLVVDDVRKDDKPHNYRWLLQLANDVQVEKQMGSDTILSSPSVPGGHILVRVIAPPAGWQDGAPTITLEHYLGANAPGKGADIGKHLPGTRLVVARSNVVEPLFKVAIIPWRDKEPLPVTEHEAGGQLKMIWPDHEDSLLLQIRADHRTSIRSTIP